MSDIRVSIIVCTYNRSEILKYCLDSLEKQSADKSLYEVIVVDNNSTDDTKEVVEGYCGRNSNFRYVFERDQGLSHARNRGAKEAKAEWVGYVDDDARCLQDYVEKTIRIIDEDKFDCFGGRYIAWFKENPPKWLIRMNVGSAPIVMEKTGVLPTQHLSGTSIFIRKDVFDIAGGFNVNLGVKGNKRGYGEETELVDKIRNAGYLIGYSPDLTVEHLVNTLKFNVLWHLRDNLAFAEAEYLIWISSKARLEKARILSRIFISFFTSFFNSTASLIKTDDYYWQNYLIDILKPMLKLCGYLRAVIKDLNK